MSERIVPRCIAERRAALRAEHITRHEALGSLAYRLSTCGYITEEERDLLYTKAEEEWDDAIHVASPDDPLRSLCGSYGRNLADLPDMPDAGSGCWTCMHKADELQGLAHAAEDEPLQMGAHHQRRLFRGRSMCREYAELIHRATRRTFRDRLAQTRARHRRGIRPLRRRVP